MLTQNSIRSRGLDAVRLDALPSDGRDLPNVCKSCRSLMCSLGDVTRAAAGGTCCLIGLVMILTLWLMPLGLPLVFLGTALMLSQDA